MYLFVFVLVSLALGAVGWSVLWDCGDSLSYSNVVLNTSMYLYRYMVTYVYPLWTRNPNMDTLPNIEDPHKIPHVVAFYQGLHCLLFRERTNILWKL